MSNQGAQRFIPRATRAWSRLAAFPAGGAELHAGGDWRLPGFCRRRQRRTCTTQQAL